MREAEMFDPLILHLKQNGYEILQENRGYKHGIDILASRKGNKTYVELKGDGDPASRDMKFGSALYQVMKRIKPESDEEYVIAISKQLYTFATDCKYAMKQLGIQAYLVDAEVERLF